MNLASASSMEVEEVRIAALNLAGRIDGPISAADALVLQTRGARIYRASSLVQLDRTKEACDEIKTTLFEHPHLPADYLRKNPEDRGV